ncbi:hypothetical protein SDC9_59006 [bioreactor metagenome]|uniref:Secretion system C-terminal sorting domain-containing protein n=1 Tax=bioreactor metagenome TaxID=1076179 RepID=A0A644X912_9ZZZZ
MTLSGVDNSNYFLTQPIGITANITPKELTVTGTVAQNKIYDGTTDAVISGSVLQGAIGSEDVNLIESGTFAQADTGTAIAVTVNMSLSGADISNYYLSQPTGLTADILQREVTIAGTFTVANKTYDGTTNATITDNQLTLVNTIVGDDISLANVVAEFQSTAVANNVSVTITNADLTGTDSGNYILSLVGSPTTTANILSGVGMDETFNADFNVYPNPATSYVNITCTEQISKIVVFNAAGQVVSEVMNSSVMNIENFDTGLYLINVTTSNGNVLSGKFMKE